MSSKLIKLATGIEMPRLGLGTWQSKPNEVKNAVITALTDGGYTAIDGAWIYGNENEIGEALEELKETVDRKDVFITSKLWNNRHKPQEVRPALNETLTSLKTDYLDLYLIHWPVGFDGQDKFPKDDNGDIILDNTPHSETWKEMEELYREGLVKNIGVSNFNISQLEALLESADIVPHVNQVELHPYLQQKELIAYCKEHNIVVTAYSPLGSPGTASCSNMDRVLDDEVLTGIAEKYNKTTAHVCIRFQIQSGVVVIPKSVTPSRIISNNDVWDFELTDDEMEAIRNIDRSQRYIKATSMSKSPYYPFEL
eukprot:TRINITY_DN7159_c0_g1_i1.p1 TRINITY_DN7159_c0_g1~~TRINITY_DN7159_c0_g1_i1.p1  ORF type:complete len:311 (+),score=131.82 TRINITY_DN7159_c0_g1_i1:60-992(+)